jgi:hypothetical protein
MISGLTLQRVVVDADENSSCVVARIQASLLRFWTATQLTGAAHDVISTGRTVDMTEGGEQENVERVRDWIGRLQAFVSSLDDIEGTTPSTFGENACEAWQSIAMSDTPPKTSPAILIAFEALNALMKVMAKLAMDWADTPDVRDRLTRDAAQQLAKDELDGIVRHGQRWLSEGMPSAEQIQQRLAVVAADIKEAKDAFEKRNAEFDEDDAQAAADPYGAILGYHDLN